MGERGEEQSGFMDKKFERVFQKVLTMGALFVRIRITLSDILIGV